MATTIAAWEVKKMLLYNEEGHETRARVRSNVRDGHDTVMFRFVVLDAGGLVAPAEFSHSYWNVRCGFWVHCGEVARRRELAHMIMNLERKLASRVDLNHVRLVVRRIT